MLNSEISFLVDTMLVETVLAEPSLYKRAGFVSDLLSRVKEYFASKIDPNNPTASIINELAPGVLWVTFKSLGIGKLGLLLSLLMSVFHVDVSGMLSSLYGKVKAMIGGGNKVSSSQIDDAVNGTIQEHSTSVTDQEVQEGYQKLQSMPTAELQPSDDKVYSSLDLLHDAKIISLALIEYEDQNLRLTKNALDFSSFRSGYGRSRSKGTTILGRIFGWIFKIALGSAGLMVAGDVVNKMLGRPNSLDHTYRAGKEEVVSPEKVSPLATQTVFPFKGDSPLPSSMPVVNNSANIDNMIVQFAKDVYSGLDGKENLIRSVPSFQAVKEQIVWYNIHNEGSAMTFIPPTFTSKRQLVDYFIDDVAKGAK
jgi:hypothetical protein